MDWPPDYSFGRPLAGCLKQDTPGPRHRVCVSVIQANISPLEKMDPDLFDHNVDIHLYFTEQSFMRAHPDLVIWPETAFPDDLLTKRPMASDYFSRSHRQTRRSFSRDSAYH